MYGLAMNSAVRRWTKDDRTGETEGMAGDDKVAYVGQEKRRDKC